MSATLRTLLTHTRSCTAAGQRRVQGQPVHLLQPCSRPRPYVPLLSRWWLAHAHDARPAPFPHVCRAHTMLTRHYCVIAAGTVTATQRRVNPGLRMFGELTILGITTSTTLIIDPSVPYVRTPAAATNCSCPPPPPLPPTNRRQPPPPPRSKLRRRLGSTARTVRCGAPSCAPCPRSTTAQTVCLLFVACNKGMIGRDRVQQHG